MEFQRPTSCYAFGKVIRPEPKSFRKTVIRGMSFRIYRLAKNQANRGPRERGLVQISSPRNAGSEDRTLELRLPATGLQFSKLAGLPWQEW